MTLMSPQEPRCVFMVIRCFFILLLLTIKTMEHMLALCWPLGTLLCITPLGLHHIPPLAYKEAMIPHVLGTSIFPKDHGGWKGPRMGIEAVKLQVNILSIFLGLGSALLRHCRQRDQRLPQFPPVSIQRPQSTDSEMAGLASPHRMGSQLTQSKLCLFILSPVLGLLTWHAPVSHSLPGNQFPSHQWWWEHPPWPDALQLQGIYNFCSCANLFDLVNCSFP